MRIKPWIITAAAAAVSVTALAVIITQNDPMATTTVVLALFWLALGLSLWSVIATLLLMVQAGIVRAIAIGALGTFAGLGLVNVSRMGMLTTGLLIGILSATLALSVFLWWRMMHGKRNP